MGKHARQGDAADPLRLRRGEWGRRASLRDGTTVLLRQIRPEDRWRLAEGVRRLSAASRYLRFHTDLAELTPSQLDYLTHVDHVDHEAIVALDVEHPEVPGVGVARYIRDGIERGVAEAAVTVADEYQARGAGTMLMGALARRAREHGIEVFRSYVLDDNQGMLEIFDQLGAQRERAGSGLWRVDLPLPQREDDLPDSPAGRAFMAAAKEGFTLSSLFPPVWQLRSRATDRHGERDDDALTHELLRLRDELGPWLADRDARTAGWPTSEGADADDRGAS